MKHVGRFQGRADRYIEVCNRDGNSSFDRPLSDGRGIEPGSRFFVAASRIYNFPFPKSLTRRRLGPFLSQRGRLKEVITIRKNKTGLEIILNRFVVPRTRLELTRANAHHPLKVACLPIPPPGPRFPPQRVFRCANIVTILFFPKYTAKKLPGHETDPAIRRCF